MPAPPRKLAREGFFAAADERLAYAREHQGGFVFFRAPAGVALENVPELSDLQLGIVAPANELERPAGPTIVSLGNEDGHEEWLLPPLRKLRNSSKFTASRASETEYGRLVTVQAELEVGEEMASLRIGERVHVAPAMVWLAALSDWEDQTIRVIAKVGRNEPCGSGAKYKRCCGA